MGTSEAYYQYTHELYHNIAEQQQETETYTEELGWHYPNEEINENWERIDYEHNEYGDSLCIPDYTLSDEWHTLKAEYNPVFENKMRSELEDITGITASKLEVEVDNVEFMWDTHPNELHYKGNFTVEISYGSTNFSNTEPSNTCLLYTSDAADE